MADTNNVGDNSDHKGGKPLIPSDKLYGADTEFGKTTVIDTEDDEVVQIEYDDGEVVRGAWGGKLEFMLTAVGYAVGLGNVWRFPYLCYRNGGGAFLIPYGIMLILVGLPIFFMEFAFGQFASLGPISVWSISPLFKGIGYGMVIISWIVCAYYNVIIAHCFFYLFSSFTTKLPWADCGNHWNTNNCTTFGFINGTNITEVRTNYSTSPTDEYYERYVLEMSEGIEDMGAPSWKLSLLLLFAWAIVLLALIKGVETLGKAAYFTATFPYLILTILLIRGLTLEGSVKGVLFYVKPQFHRLLDYRVWTDAATQIFFSLGVCNGGLITMSSYNNFKNNCRRDAVLVALINCATSVFAGLVIFTNLGFMAHLKGVEVQDVAKGGPGLAFIVYPEALNEMPIAPLWSILFFIMMCTLGFGSQFSMMETVLSGFSDELARVRIIKNNKHKIMFRVALCLLTFLLGIPMTCRGGIYLLNLVDWAISGFPLLLIALSELVVVIYFYGIKQFERDIMLMVKEKPNWYWRATWCVITPLVITVLVIAFFALPQPITMDDYIYPTWVDHINNLIGVAPIMPIPVFFLYRYCKDGGFILLKEFAKPKFTWGPADEEHRNDFYAMLMQSKNKKLMKDNADGENMLTMPEDPNEAGLHDDAVAAADNFFQSRTSIIQKLTVAANKENSKRQSVTNSLVNLANTQVKIDSSQMVLTNNLVDRLRNEPQHSSPNLNLNLNSGK